MPPPPSARSTGSCSNPCAGATCEQTQELPCKQLETIGCFCGGCCVDSASDSALICAFYRTLSDQSTPGQWRTGAQIKQDCSVVGVSHCLVSEKQQRGLCNDYNERVFLLPLCY